MITVEGINLYDVKDLAKTLRVTPVTVKRYIRTGKLTAQRIGRRYYVSSDNLKKFLSGSSRRTSHEVL